MSICCSLTNRTARATTNGLTISDRTDSLWQSTAACSMPTGAAAQRRPMHHHSMPRSRNIVAPQQQQHSNSITNNNYNKMLSSSHSSPREISASPRRVALDTTASGSTSGFGFSRGKTCLADALYGMWKVLRSCSMLYSVRVFIVLIYFLCSIEWHCDLDLD